VVGLEGNLHRAGEAVDDDEQVLARFAVDSRPRLDLVKNESGKAKCSALSSITTEEISFCYTLATSIGYEVNNMDE
jgi:hypothetical protein